jgi:alkylation response protein AidB-like acyl-CoA dehydrogenase
MSQPAAASHADLYSESERLWAARAHEFARGTLEPLRQKIDEGGRCRELIRELGSQRLLGTLIPTEYGGEGLDNVHNALVSAELSATSPSLAAMRAVSVVFTALPLLAYANDEQKRSWLPPMVDGTASYSLAITEPGAGSDAGSMSVTARADGSSYVIDGVKHYISGSAENDAALAYVVTNPDARARERYSAFLVPLGSDGIRVEPIPTTGLRGFSHARVEFNGVRVDQDRLVGEPGQGFEIMMYGLQPERVDIAARALGCTERALDEAADFAAERVQFGRAIREFQAVSHAIADMRATVEAVRLLVHRAARLVDAGEPANQMTAIAKLMACERGFAVCDQAMQVLGARGYTSGSAVDVMFRDIRALRYGGGTDEIMRHVIQREEFAARRNER